MLFKYINQRISALDSRKNEIYQRVKKLGSEKCIPDCTIDYHSAMWDELSFDDKRQVADILIRVIYATSEKIIIQWRYEFS